MRRKLAAFVSVLLLLGVSTAFAQDNRTVTWKRWDVSIDHVDTAHNQFSVTEVYDLQFSGTFHYGSATISLDKVTDITNVQVTEDGQLLQASCSQQSGTVCTENSAADKNISITYYFFQPITDSDAHFEISYTVDGALSIYAGGDQLWWTAVPSDHFGFPVEDSTITVKMPQGSTPRKGVDPVVIYGATSDVEVNGNTIIATAKQPITGDQDFEIRVQYPHNPEAQPASWQAGYDQQVALTNKASLQTHDEVFAGLLLIMISASVVFLLVR